MLFRSHSGDDVLTGDAGADVFVFARRYGRDTISDLDAVGGNHDTIDLSGFSQISDFADLQANHLTTHGRNVWIDAGNGDVLVLKGVELADLGKADFLF